MPEATVKISYLGLLRPLVPQDTENVALTAGATVQECLAQLAARHGAAFARLVHDERGQVRPSLVVLVDGVRADLRAPRTLKGGEDIVLLTPIAGG